MNFILVPPLPGVAEFPPGSAGFQPAASSDERCHEHRARARMPALPGRLRSWQAHLTGMSFIRNQEGR